MSLITISNEVLTVTLDTAGAVFHSIQKDGVEYLWQGSEKYWKFRDKNLFPYIGRMTDGCYLLGDQKFPTVLLPAASLLLRSSQNPLSPLRSQRVKRRSACTHSLSALTLLTRSPAHP